MPPSARARGACTTSEPTAVRAVAYKKYTAVTISRVVLLFVDRDGGTYNLRLSVVDTFSTCVSRPPPHYPPDNVRSMCLYMSIRGTSKIPRCYRRCARATAVANSVACTTRRVVRIVLDVSRLWNNGGVGGTLKSDTFYHCRISRSNTNSHNTTVYYGKN